MHHPRRCYGLCRSRGSYHSYSF